MVNKITSPITPLGEINKINEIIDELDNIDPLPSQTGQSGKYLTTNGTVPSWADVQSLPSQTGKAGKFLQTDGTDASWESAPFRNIGEIVASTIPLTDAGLHLLDGSLIQGSGIYSAFVTYIAGLVSTYPNLFATENDWQTAVSTYGVCGKFVYDSTNNTVRLPKITGKIDGTTDVSVLGDLEPLFVKLPNITGTFSDSRSGAVGTHTGCFSNSYNRGTSAVYDGGISGHMLNFDASLSSSVYSGNGTDTTVHEQAINVLLYIVIATSTKTDIEVDIDEIATDLNSKVSTGDLAEVQCVIETYSNGTSWYRVYSDGWCEQGGVSPYSVSTYTATFLKPYINTNYNIVIADIYQGDSGGGSSTNPDVAERTTTYLRFSLVSGSNRAVCWQTAGYIV